MLEHGEFDLKLTGNVVHTFPVNGFNEFGIQRIRAAILDLAKGLEKWALFEHPKSLAGLTPEASEEISRSYEEFSDRGCVLIALEISPVWGEVIRKSLGNDFPIPVHFDTNAEQLDQLIDNRLSGNLS